MRVEFACHACAARLSAPAGRAGAAARCPHCGTRLTVPGPPPGPAAPPPAAARCPRCGAAAAVTPGRAAECPACHAVFLPEEDGPPAVPPGPWPRRRAVLLAGGAALAAALACFLLVGRPRVLIVAGVGPAPAARPDHEAELVRAVAGHPWWSAPLPEGRVRELADVVCSLQADEAVGIDRRGVVDRARWRGWDGDAVRAVLATGGGRPPDHLLVFLDATRHARRPTRVEALELLRQLLDQEDFRRPRGGDGGGGWGAAR